MSMAEKFTKITAALLSACMIATSAPVLAADDDRLLSMDFESYSVGETPSGLVNSEVVDYSGSKALSVKADKFGTSVKMDKFILGEFCVSFDIAAPSTDFDGTVNVASGGDRRRTLVKFESGKILAGNGKQVGKVSDKYTHIAVSVDPVKKCFDMYVNGKKMFDKAYIDALSNKCMSVIFKFTATGSETRVILDNMLLHSTQVKTAKCPIYNPYGYVEQSKDIKFTSEKDRIYYKTFGTYSATMAIMDDKNAIHMGSGVVHANGEKYRLTAMPYYENGEYMVPQKAVEDLLNTTVTADGNSVTVGTAKLEIGSTSMQYSSASSTLDAAPVENDGILYLPLRAIAEKAFGKYVFHDDTAVSPGMVIIANSKFNPPDTTAKMQVLNDYLFYIRPSWQDILADYNKSEVKGVHPRVMITPTSVAQLKQEITDNAIKKSWYDRLIEYSDKIVDYDTLKYELRDGVRLMYVSSDFETYMLCLGMAYQLTGDRKYADAAWKHIEAVANFPDWNPGHPIDVGIMAVGYAVAYDWMYDCWTPEQRAIMEQGAVHNCFYVANETYKGSSESMDGVINAQNFNCICNGGISMAALAFMDVDPELSARLTSEAVRCLEYMIPNFAPHGMWYEGPSYAAMTINYTCKMLSSIESVLGDLYCLDDTEGFDKAAEFLSYCQSDVGCYNFGDAEAGAATTPGLFWLFNHFGIKNMKDTVATSRRYVNNYDSTLVDSLIWYSTAEENDKAENFLDKYYDGNDLVTMRNNYNSGQVFVGLKGGSPSRAHEHLDEGSFIFDAMGVRWAHDMGKDNYNLPGYNGNDLELRYKIFRLRASSHNTIVINPSEEAEYEIGARAEVTDYESKPRGTKVVIDMSKVLEKNVKSAKRGFLFTDNRTSLVVRDEISLARASDVYWHMYTKAKTEIDGNTVILTDATDSAKQVKLEFVSNVAGEISIEPAAPTDTSPVVAGQSANADFTRIVYHIKGSGNVNITAKLTPTAYGGSTAADYNVPIAEWTVPDGEAEPIPTLDKLIIGGEEYDPEERFVTISCESEDSPVPEIEAASDKYDVEIVRAESVTDKSYIYLRDPKDPDTAYSYTISYNPQKLRRVIDGYDLPEIKSVVATDEPQPDNIAINVLDGKPATRWSAEREQSLLFELENESEIDTYIMSMYSGHTRQTFFDVYVSADGNEYEKVYSGATSGTTSDYEMYDIGSHKVKYIKVDFHGASSSTWNSVTEVAVGLKK